MPEMEQQGRKVWAEEAVMMTVTVSGPRDREQHAVLGEQGQDRPECVFRPPLGPVHPRIG